MTLRRSPPEFSIVVIRHDSRAVLFSRCNDEAGARALVEALARLGLRASISRTIPKELPPGSNVPAIGEREATP